MSTELTARIRADLAAALARRDRTTARALRTVLGVIANAEAVPVTEAPALPDAPLAEGTIAGATAGLGAAEAARRELTDDDVRTLVAGERDELLAAAAQVEGPAPQRAQELRAAAQLLASYL